MNISLENLIHLEFWGFVFLNIPHYLFFCFFHHSNPAASKAPAHIYSVITTVLPAEIFIQDRTRFMMWTQSTFVIYLITIFDLNMYVLKFDVLNLHIIQIHVLGKKIANVSVTYQKATTFWNISVPQRFSPMFHRGWGARCVRGMCGRDRGWVWSCGGHA